MLIDYHQWVFLLYTHVPRHNNPQLAYSEVQVHLIMIHYTLKFTQLFLLWLIQIWKRKHFPLFLSFLQSQAMWLLPLPCCWPAWAAAVIPGFTCFSVGISFMVSSTFSPAAEVFSPISGGNSLMAASAAVKLPSWVTVLRAPQSQTLLGSRCNWEIWKNSTSLMKIQWLIQGYFKIMDECNANEWYCNPIIWFLETSRNSRII